MTAAETTAPTGHQAARNRRLGAGAVTAAETTASRRAASTLFTGLIDDAAMFPPKRAALGPALADHLARRDRAEDRFTGLFLIPAAAAAELLDALGAAPPSAPLGLGLIGSSDPAATLEAAARLLKSKRVRLEIVELPPDPAGDPTDAADRAASVARSWGGGPPRLLCEMPHSWLSDDRITAAASAFSKAGLGAKLRTGGAEPGAFPTAAAVARFVTACAGPGVVFKCTAGLHRAVRHRDPVSGATHHGFANILLATGLAVEEAPTKRIQSALEESDWDTVAENLRGLSAEQAASVRRLFLGFGSCDTAAPAAAMADLLGSNHS